MMKMRALIAAWIFPVSVAAADVLPPSLVGVWGTEGSVFRSSGLIGGEAIYLDSSGEGALVGAPLPVGMCADRICTPIIGIRLRASYNRKTNRISAILIHGEQQIEIGLVHDAAANVLVMTSGTSEERRFRRREPAVPVDFEAALQGAAGISSVVKPLH